MALQRDAYGFRKELFRFRHLAISILISTLLSSCHGSEPGGQVLAVVDGKELTMSHFESALHNAAGGADPRDPEVRAKVAQGLIDQTLFTDAAEREGVDRDPEVMLAMERARSAVLAQAYLARITPTSPINVDDLQAWYNAHPQVYRDRRQYLVTDVAVNSAPGVDLAALVAPLQKSLPLDKLVEMLRAKGADIEIRNYQFASDAVEPDMARAFAPLSPGEGYSFVEKGRRHFGRVERATPEPVEFADAALAIRDRMLTERVRSAADAKLEALRRTNSVKLGELGQNVLKRRSFDGADDGASAQPGVLSPDARKRAIEAGVKGL